MKVIHLSGGGDVGGAKTHIHTLLSGLNERIETRLISFREGAFADEAREQGIDVRILGAKNPFAVCRELKKMILSEGFDIVHCHGARGNMIGAMLKKLIKRPVITTVHSDYRLDYLGRPAARLTYGMVNKLALRCLDYRVGVSAPMCGMLIDRGFRADRMFTIYNGVDFDIDEEKKVDRAEFLASLGLNLESGDVVAGIAARLNPVKDIKTLISAFASISDKRKNLKIIIAGDGELKDELKAQAKRLGVDKRVVFAGWVEDTDSFYRSIDINLLTSLSETFPYALTEGARMALPTISSRVGGVPVLISHGVNGFLFEPGDEKALAGYLDTLAGDAELRLVMGQSLYEKAKREFSIKNTIDTQIEIYETILRREKRPAYDRDGVVICGAYGKGNAGDDAILESLLGTMKRIDPDMPVTVLSRAPKATMKAYGVRAIYTFNIFKFLRSVRRARLYINGGGSLMQDATSSRSLWFYLFTIFAANTMKSRVMMYGCGIGPISRRLNRTLAKKIINKRVDTITLREDSSVEELKKLGVSAPRVMLSADPALTLAKAPDELINSAMIEAGLKSDGAYIGFCLRRWKGYEKKTDVFAAAAKYTYDKYGLVPVFIPIEPSRDVSALRMAAEKTKCPWHLIEKGYPAVVLAGIIARMRVVLSMRLHALIFAAGQGVATVGVPYDPKVKAFLEYIGQHLYVDLEELDFERLRELIDKAAARADDRESLLQSVDRLALMEEVNLREAKLLIEGYNRAAKNTQANTK